MDASVPSILLRGPTSSASGLCLALLLASVSARADDYPACDKKPTPEDVEAAKGMHKAAEQYYATAKYERAIESWRDAYNFDCTAHRLLINIGNAFEKLGQTAKAIEAFEVYLERAGDKADPTIRDKVANLKALVERPPDPLPEPTPDPDPVPLPVPDEHEDESEGPGAGPWVVVGGGALVAITGGVLLGVGLERRAFAFDAGCKEDGDIDTDGDGLPDDKGPVCPDEESTSAANLGRTLPPAGGVLLGVGLLAVGGGILWYVLDSPSDDSAGDVHLDVAAGPGFAGFGLSGRY
jgi:hypothetical protein